MIPEMREWIYFFHVFQINDLIWLMASSSSQPLMPPDLIHGVPSKASPLQSSKFNFIPSLSSPSPSPTTNSFIPSREQNLSSNSRSTSGRKKVNINLSIFNLFFQEISKSDPLHFPLHALILRFRRWKVLKVFNQI